MVSIRAYMGDALSYGLCCTDCQYGWKQTRVKCLALPNTPRLNHY
jgi:hypothetical protein